MSIMRGVGASIAIVLFCPAVLLQQEVKQSPRLHSGEARETAAASCEQIHMLFPQAPAGTFPTHKYKFEYHAPKNLVYPRAGQPAGVTVYPYYTTRGPTDFFMDDENALNR